MHRSHDCTGGRVRWRRAGRGIALVLATAACQDTPPPAWESPELPARLQQARELHFRGVGGDAVAAGQARAMLEQLAAEAPGSARVRAYLGSARLLQAREAWAPWDKGRLAAAGIELLDEAVAAAPDDVEVRFLRGVSTLPLPARFARAETARADIAWASARAAAAVRRGAIDARIAGAIENAAAEPKP